MVDELKKQPEKPVLLSDSQVIGDHQLKSFSV